ncbi:MAG TPA: ABC transporter substrate-binding protein [Stellaceae bacterium]|nr:ABC transporter substrate-binding protein [Stellaceae bacterium]
MMRRRSLAAACGLVLLGLALGGAAQAVADEPVHLRIGWVVVPADIMPLIFHQPGWAPHAGKTYVPELTHFTGTPTEMTALATGDLDIAALAYSTLALGVENAGMDDLRVIADVFQDGVPGYHTNGMLVRNDSGIKTVDDLKHKIVATNQTGSAVDVAVRAMLAKHNLQDKRDLTMIEVRFPDMKAMLKEKKVDLITAVNPFSFDPELATFAHPLFTQEEAVGRTQMIVVVARQGFIEKNRAALVDFLEDYIAAQHRLSDPAHRDETLKLIADVTKQPESYYQDWVFTKQDYYRDPGGLPDMTALQQNVDLAKQLGFLHAPLEVGKYADLTIAKEADKRIEAAANH